MGCALCRSCVSKQKKRLQEDSFDLDLTVLHKNIGVMGYPSTGLEACYRNPYSEVLRYLDKAFGDKYLVVNLCSEPDRQYDGSSYFHGRCIQVPFPDHNPCQLVDIPDFIERAQTFVQAGGEGSDKESDRIVFIHCKAGKGRSGLMACAMLMAMCPDLCSTADKAMDYYGRTRTHNNKGLTIPSQRRYVQYYEQLRNISGGAMPSAVPVIELQALTISGLWDHIKAAEVVRIRIGRYDSNQLIQFSTKAEVAKRGDGVIITEDTANDTVTISFRDCQFALLKALQGDVRIDFLKSGSGKAIWLASLTFNTLFVKPFYNAKEIDKLYKKKVAGTAGFGLSYAKVAGGGGSGGNSRASGAGAITHQPGATDIVLAAPSTPSGVDFAAGTQPSTFSPDGNNTIDANRSGQPKRRVSADSDVELDEVTLVPAASGAAFAKPRKWGSAAGSLNASGSGGSHKNPSPTEALEDPML